MFILRGIQTLFLYLQNLSLIIIVVNFGNIPLNLAVIFLNIFFLVFIQWKFYFSSPNTFWNCLERWLTFIITLCTVLNAYAIHVSGTWVLSRTFLIFCLVWRPFAFILFLCSNSIHMPYNLLNMLFCLNIYFFVITTLSFN